MLFDEGVADVWFWRDLMSGAWQRLSSRSDRKKLPQPSLGNSIGTLYRVTCEQADLTEPHRGFFT